MMEKMITYTSAVVPEPESLRTLTAMRVTFFGMMRSNFFAKELNLTLETPNLTPPIVPLKQVTMKRA